MKLPRDDNERQQLYILMQYLYIQQRWSKKQIAAYLGVSHQWLWRLAQRYGMSADGAPPRGMYR